MITVADDKQWRNLKSDLSSCRFVTNVAVKEYIHKNISLMPIRQELMTLKLSSGDLNSLTTGSTRSLGIKKLTTDSYAPVANNNHHTDVMDHNRRLELGTTKSTTKSWRTLTNAVPKLFRSFPVEKEQTNTFSNHNKSLSDLNCDTTTRKQRRKAPRRRSSLTGISEHSALENFQSSTELQTLEKTACILRMAIEAQLNQKASCQDSCDSSASSQDPCCNDDTKKLQRRHSTSRLLSRKTNTNAPKITRTERMITFATSKQEAKEKGSLFDEFDQEPGFFAPPPSTKCRVPQNVMVSDNNEDDISIITTLSDVGQRLPNSDVHKKMAKRMSRIK